MDKENGPATATERTDKERGAPNLLDPAALFGAYWPRPDGANATNNNPLFAGYGGSYSSLLSRSANPGYSGAGNPYGTLSVAASQAANLGLNPASAAWWTMASQLVAHDYLASLQFGLAPNMIPSFPLMPTPPHLPSNSKTPTSNSHSKSSSGSTVSSTPPTPTSATVSQPSSSGNESLLGGVRLPPDTEIIKYTSSMHGPKIPGTTNRGRKKTISLDSAQREKLEKLKNAQAQMAQMGLDLSAKSKEPSINDSYYRYLFGLPMLNESEESAKTNGRASPPVAHAAPTPVQDDAPLNLSLKPAEKTPETPPSNHSSAINLSTSALQSLSSLSQSLGHDRNRRKPGPKPRRVPPFTTPESPHPSSGSEENEPVSYHKDGRPRNLGRGVSKPKKNTVASLLAQSRALGIKPSHPLELSQLAALSKITSPLPGPDLPKPPPSLTPYKSLEELRSLCGDSVSDDRSTHSHSELSDDASDGEGKGSISSDGTGGKRARLAVDEVKLREALERGWKRETFISGVGTAGIKGEVVYTSPCGRNFKNHGDLVRFLEKHNSELTRDHFSFSCRILLGDYIETTDQCKEPIRLSEDMLALRLNEMLAQYRASMMDHGKQERERMALAAKEAKRLAKEEAARQREQLRLLKEQERNERQEAARKERELRNQQLLEGRKRLAFTSEEKWHIIREIESGKSKSDVSRELGLANSTVATIWKQRGNVMPTPGAGSSPARKKRQEELEKQKIEAQQRKAQEREMKRQQAAILKEQMYMQELNKQRELLYTVELERERRRQHMTLVKALELRKRLEEREKKRLEQRAEKLATREKRIEQRKVEIELLRELRKPVEDMELTDPKPLPELPRVPGLRLSGQAFSDLLMTHEFLLNFGETLGFDPESLPTLNSLQDALLGLNEESEDELLSVITQLVICGIEDPGIPHPARHTTMLGHSLRAAEISHSNLSEILRIYLYANATGEVKATTGVHFEREREKKVTEHHNNMNESMDDAGGKNSQFFQHLKENQTYKMSEWLKKKPYLALNPTQKASILAFLCHELLQNKAVIKQIDSAIDTVAQLKRERWPIEANLRKLKHLQNKKNKGVGMMVGTPNNGANHNNNNLPNNKESEPTTDEFEAAEVESCNDSDITQPEEDELSKINLTESLAQVSKQAEQNTTALAAYSLQLRATAIGQDRYHRRYWCLSTGIYVEGMESADPELFTETINDPDPEPPVKKEKIEVEEEENEEVKKEEKEEKEVEVKEEKVEKMEVEETKEEVKEEVKPEVVEAKEIETQTENGKVKDEEGEVEGKDKEGGWGSEEGQWFSLVPREPCDPSSLTHSQPSRHINDCAELRIPVPMHSSCAASPCPSPLPLPLSVEEAAMLEHCKTHGLPQPGTPQPIPRTLKRGWWRISQNQLQDVVSALEPRGLREREFIASITRMRTDHTWEPTLKACSVKDPSISDLKPDDEDDEEEEEEKDEGPEPIPEPDDPESWSSETALRVDLAALQQVEALEEKVASASMQLKGWKPPHKASTSDVGWMPACLATSASLNPVEVGKQRLHGLLLSIEKRYLKPPLGNNTGDLKIAAACNNSSSSSHPTTNGDGSETPEKSKSKEDQEVKGVIVWREALNKSQTAAQLAMLAHALEASVAWDKSIMKANCQFCHSGDNEDKLLLCDGCDKGYHTYCFKPVMEEIPEGDWYCYLCLNQAKGEKNCIVCGKKTGRNLLQCEACPISYHTDCMTPPLNKVPRGKWYCSICITKHPKKKPTRKPHNTSHSSPAKTVPEDNTSTDSLPPPNLTPATEEPPAVERERGTKSPSPPGISRVPTPPPLPIAEPPSPPPPPPPPRREKSLKKLNKEMAPCRQLLDDLEAHEEAWPFLLAVNTKQFPTYRKIIRNPMDLQTIGKRLAHNEYKSREDFVSDVRLIFDNCETFNEDNSPVGKAGHTLRLFFEAKWAEVTNKPPV